MVTIRRARLDEIEFLQTELAKHPKQEQVDISKTITHVAEYEDERIMFLSGRLIWQFEPLLEIETKKKIPINARRRAALLLCLAMEKFIATSSVPIRSYFAHVLKRPVWKWLEKLKFHRIYPGGRLYAKDV